MDINSVYGKIDAIKFIRDLKLVNEAQGSILDGDSNYHNLGLKESKDIVEKIINTCPHTNPTFEWTKARDYVYNALDAVNMLPTLKCHDLDMLRASNILRNIDKARKAIASLLQTLDNQQ